MTQSDDTILTRPHLQEELFLVIISKNNLVIWIFSHEDCSVCIRLEEGRIYIKPDKPGINSVFFSNEFCFCNFHLQHISGRAGLSFRNQEYSFKAQHEQRQQSASKHETKKISRIPLKPINSQKNIFFVLIVHLSKNKTARTAVKFRGF